MSAKPTLRAYARILPLAAWHGLKIGLIAGFLITVITLPMAAFNIDLRDAMVVTILAVTLIAVMIPVSFWEARRSHLAERMRKAASDA